MRLSLAPLLLHTADAPAVRTALHNAFVAPASERRHHLEAAASALRELGLDCADACELVGLAG